MRGPKISGVPPKPTIGQLCSYVFGITSWRETIGYDLTEWQAIHGVTVPPTDTFKEHFLGKTRRTHETIAVVLQPSSPYDPA